MPLGASRRVDLRDIQHIIDRLSDVLSRPTAVDDAQFRLLFHSPQRGPLDQVRIDSILHRDAPGEAKEWVRSQGVARMVGLHRLSGASQIGLLPRAYVPIRQEGALLGYLWVIDADQSLDLSSTAAIESAAAELAPLLYRRRTLDLLDRRRERDAVRSLLSEDPAEQRHGASQLEAGGVLATDAQPCVVVVEIADTRLQPLDESDQLMIDAAMERCRGLVTESDIAHVSQDGRGVVILATGPGRVERVEDFASSLTRECRVGCPDRRIVAGVGSPQPTLSMTQRSYREALATTRILSRVPALGDVLAHDELGVYDAIARIPDAALTPELVPPALHRLFAADQGSELTETLESFLDAAGDVASVASGLHLHRSSVYSRLRRVERITGCNLGDGQDRLLLHLGLALARTVGREALDPPV